MVINRERYALDWIKDELLETLDAARQGLEDFAESWEHGAADADPEGLSAQDASLHRCIEALHQVRGGLVILELVGVSRLVDHLERLAVNLRERKVQDVAAACQSLMQGILELPSHLDALGSGAPDSDAPVLPLINELRQHLREPALEDASLAGRLQGAVSDAALARFEAIDGVDKTRRIRSVYQQVLLSLLKSGDLALAAETLRKVAEGMRRVCEGTPLELQWQAFGEFVESLTADSATRYGPLDADAVKLLRRVDAEIREIMQSRATALERPVSMSLMRQLIDAATSRGRASATLDALRDAVEAVQRPGALSLPGRQALASAATALREELSTAKDRLDLFVRSASRDVGELADLIAPLKQVASTLSLLGFESSKSIVLDQLDVLATLVEAGRADESAILSVAGALVQVDDNLSSLTNGGRGEIERLTGDAQRAVAEQARVGLERVKQALVDFASSQWDVRHLPEVPGELSGIAGALGMIPLVRAAALTQRCRDYVAEELMAGHVPSWEELDRLADAISGIDYYLERTAQTSGGAEEVLALVQRRLDDLSPVRPPARLPETTREIPAPETAAPEAAAPEALAIEPPAVEARAPDVPVSVLQSQPHVPDAAAAAAAAASAESAAEPVAAELAAAAAAAAVDAPAAGVAAVSDEGESVLQGSAADPDDVALEREFDPAFDLSSGLFDAISGAPPTPPPPPSEAFAAAASGAVLEDDFQCDDEIAGIFLEEVEEVLGLIDAHADAWEAALDDARHQAEIRRAFHTLKGSGRMVGANVLGEMAWSVENMLNRVVDGTVAPTAEFVAVVRDARQLTSELCSAFAQQAAPAMPGVARVMEQADMLASGGTLADTEDQPSAGGAAGSAVGGAAEDGSGASEYLQLFVSEAQDYLETLAAGVRGDGFVLDETTLRALHTLTGSAAVAGLSAIGELAGPVYDLAQALRRPGSETLIGGEPAEFFRLAAEALTAMVDEVREGREPEEHFQLLAEADRLLVDAQTPQGPDPLLALPSLGQLLKVEAFLDAWRDGAMDMTFAEDLRRALAEVGAVAQEHGAIAQLAGVLIDAHQRYEFAALDGHAHEVLGQGHEQLLVQIDAVAADQTPVAAPELQAAIEQLAAPRDASDSVVIDLFDHADFGELALDGTLPEPETGLEAILDSDLDADPDSEIEAEVRWATAELPDLPEAPAARPSEDLDEEIIGVFFEEADELLEALEQGINDWSEAPENLLHLENLLRALHTLKGGARLSGMARLGDRTHDLESFLSEFQDGARVPQPPAFERLHERYDELAALVADGKRQLAGMGAVPEADSGWSVAPLPSDAPPAGAAEHLMHAVPEAPGGPAPLDDFDVEASDDESSDDEDAGVPGAPADNVTRLPAAAAAASAEQAAPRAPRPASAAGRREARAVDGPQEMVRVGAGLLEALVNLAGESSIIRARVEQGMSDFTGALDEMESTLHRLREQLRRLDIEAEGQVLFRRERGAGQTYENFDPLEMDRYSQLQQLSRSLTESASDLLDLKDTLLVKSREAETLLLQQARVNTELQEGLMRSRMVPFSRLLPRLRRTVRQVARELDKSVELRTFNVEGELDRNLLERMVPPLEHMLRNAVDHGIETPQERRARGKAEAGCIDLRLSREGGDLVIEISDDGAGIDVERVRAKALERGLLAPDADLKDDEISQFVLAPGFSTAKSITQISGRGVGMDVVHSEVKQLGGNIDIFTQRGKGTRFLLRVPFTVSVNRALMVAVGEDLYAVPLNTIEGIVLLSQDEIERLYAPNAQTFEYAGVPYRIQYLGNFLGREYRPQQTRAAVPVVLVRSGDHAVAVHVDGVQGSREIVVKSLGPQFAGVGGISGATILGDGSVVVILDLLALVRAQSGAALRAGKRASAGVAQARRVLVVDDSVTVRKVTSRLLERQGMDVQVAKDGVEAMAMLQERRPDILLLDIEMPRMDGFEVLRQVRHDDRLADLPVVMISSRTGAKHQAHAAGLGVSGFLGKPFQESELLGMIDKLMG